MSATIIARQTLLDRASHRKRIADKHGAHFPQVMIFPEHRDFIVPATVSQDKPELAQGYILRTEEHSEREHDRKRR